MLTLVLQEGTVNSMHSGDTLLLLFTPLSVKTENPGLIQVVNLKMIQDSSLCQAKVMNCTRPVPGGVIMYVDELVTAGNIDEIKENLGDFSYVEEIEVGDVISVVECGEGYRIIVWENRYVERNAVIDFGDDYLWGEWDGARIAVEHGDEILAYDIEGDCRFLGVI